MAYPNKHNQIRLWAEQQSVTTTKKQAKDTWDTLVKKYKELNEKYKLTNKDCEAKYKIAITDRNANGEIKKNRQESYLSACRKAGDINEKLGLQYVEILRYRYVMKALGLKTQTIRNYSTMVIR